MNRIKNFYTVSPMDLKPGDVLVATVTLQVCHHKDAEGKNFFRMYRCEFEGAEADGVPQGSQMLNTYEVAKEIFPVAINAGLRAEN